MNFIYSLTLAFEHLKRFKYLALINGIIWAFIWLIIAFLSWHTMITFTSKLLNFLPFSFIKNSGAFIIYSLLWLQAILVTIGVIFSLFNEFIKKKYSLTLSIAGIVILFWTIIFISFEGKMITYIRHLLLILPFNTIEELMSALLAVLFYYMLFVATLTFSAFIFSLEKLKEIAKEEYNLEIKDLYISKLIKIIIRDFIKFIVLSIIFYPILLIPFINFVAILFLFSYMIKDSLYHIISIFDKNIDIKEIWIIAILSTFLDFLPILNIFAPIMGLLHLFYYSMEKDENI